MQKPWIVIITAMVCLTTIEIYALSKGINGMLMSVMIAAIAGLGGWVVPAPKVTLLPKTTHLNNSSIF